MRRLAAFLSIGLAPLATATVAIADESPATDAPAGSYILPMIIAGQPARMLVAPGETSTVTCTPDFARRAGLVAEDRRTFTQIGPIAVEGDVANVAFDIAWLTSRRTIVWPANNWSAAIDCAMGPDALGAAVTRFDLRPPLPGERTIALPYDRPLGKRATGNAAYARIMVGDTSIAVRFDPLRRETVATASAALVIAGALGGKLDGPTLRSEIFFGVTRPIRRVRLAEPLTVGPLSLDSVYARLSDYGDASAIRGVDSDELDPGGDIVITGTRRRKIGDVRLLRIGADQLATCSSIVFDRPAGQIRLTCR